MGIATLPSYPPGAGLANYPPWAGPTQAGAGFTKVGSCLCPNTVWDLDRTGGGNIATGQRSSHRTAGPVPRLGAPSASRRVPMIDRYRALSEATRTSGDSQA